MITYVSFISIFGHRIPRVYLNNDPTFSEIGNAFMRKAKVQRYPNQGHPDSKYQDKKMTFTYVPRRTRIGIPNRRYRLFKKTPR